MSGGIGPLANLQGKVNGNNELLVSATVSVSGADGSILDGVNPLIKATVFDLTNNNPQAVAIVDANGDQIASFGGGTQYAQGTAATTTDTMTQAGAVRRDTPVVAAGVADGDRAMLSVDSEGSLYARARQQIDGDTGAGSIPTDAVLLALPSNGAILAAVGNSGNKSDAVLRVVLATDQPALTNKLLVTPDLPTGASTAAKQPAIGTAGSSSADVISIQGIASGTAVPISVASIPSHAVTNAGVFATQVTTQIGAANLANGQITVDTTSGGVQIANTRATRRSITIVNLGTVDVYVGAGTVSTANGLLLVGVKGASITLYVTGQVKAICAISQAVSYVEEYD